MTKVNFTPTQWRVIVAAHMTGSATNADIDSRRVRTRTITALTEMGLLYSPSIDGSIGLTPAGEEAFWERGRSDQPEGAL